MGGTVFNLDKAIYLATAPGAFVFAIACLLMVYIDIPDAEIQPIVEISTNIQRFCPFVFGLYASIVLKRWWEIRTKGVGAIADHCINMSGLLVSLAARILTRDADWEAFEACHSSFVRYGIASLTCIAMESREVDDD